MLVFNVAITSLLFLAQLVALAAVPAQQSTSSGVSKRILAAIQQRHTTDATVARNHHQTVQEEHSHTPYDKPDFASRGMTPWSYGTQMIPSWRDSDGIREAGERGPNHEASHDRSLGRRGPRGWVYMDEIWLHFPDKTWILLGFLAGFFACLPCMCCATEEDQMQGFNNGVCGLSVTGVVIVSGILLTKLGVTEVFWRIHLLIWGYYWWIGLVLVPCTCLGVIGLLVFCMPAVCLSLYRIIFPPLSKDGQHGKDADDITDMALGPRMKHSTKPRYGWSDLLPYATTFLHHEPQPRPNVGSDRVPYLPLVPREPGDWDQYAAWNSSLSGT